ncbi:glycosyltransferase [Acidisoma cellulosilytica]|uniref:Glycosyltransferase n=1 Tax=Acidisoma cellulosilyticum TaxID=2802395 RepID=A0A964E4X2_9PROT|nr:glycosyltransferase [Acidisoma cellulosilyticum]MCB8882090.1 glycosyltransferase [Acidisoma cellulosilyticum]
MLDSRYRLVVGIATRGRASILLEMLAQLEQQTRLPDRIIVCGSEPSDIAGVITQFPKVETLLSPPGLCRQRNMILDAAADADLVMFFDDDFFADPAYLAAIETHMMGHPATMVASGLVLADGINGPGLTAADAHLILKTSQGLAAGTRPMFSGYGCNMAIRIKPLQTHGIRFDERLQLYCWQEDVDVSRRLSAFGNIVQLEGAQGVHLGSKRGRSPGVKLGYSQIANPLYLAGKGLGYPWHVALTLIFRNMAKNVLRAFWPESYVDRRGRLRGNVIALWHLLRGQMAPEKVLKV